jgi:hypothetical protein
MGDVDDYHLSVSIDDALKVAAYVAYRRLTVVLL